MPIVDSASQPLYLEPSSATGHARRGYKESVPIGTVDKTPHPDSTSDGDWWPEADLDDIRDLLERRHRWVTKLGVDQVLAWGPGDLAMYPVEGCGTWAAVGSCTSCHTRLAKSMSCGREWCPTCGERSSSTHLQRIERWMPKLQQMSAIGYLVIESRVAYRDELRDVSELRRARRRIMGVIKDEGILRGLGRWHYFGDPACPHCRVAKGHPKELERRGDLWTCSRCGFSARTDDLKMQYLPHINLLFDGYFMPPERLAALRERIRKADKRFYLAHYSYARLARTEGLVGQMLEQAERQNRKTIGKFRHWAHYVTRATFLSVKWAPEIADTLTETRFHTTWAWGGANRWQDPLQWGNEPTDEAGGCPLCHGHIQWDRVDLVQNVLFGAAVVSAGLWILLPPDDG